MDVIDRFERFYRELGQGAANELADVYDEQVIFVDPVAEHEGLPALKDYFQNLMQNCKSCSFDTTIHQLGSSMAFDTTNTSISRTGCMATFASTTFQIPASRN